MLPNHQEPPDAVKELVREYYANKKTRELIIHDGMFLLYELYVTEEKDGKPARVGLGNLIKRAFWPEAGYMTPEQLRVAIGVL